MGRPKKGQIARVDLICRQCGRKFSKPLSQADRLFHTIKCYRDYINDPQRLWENVIRSTDESACWPHAGPFDADGYAHVTYRGCIMTAQRAAWELASGVLIPKTPRRIVGHICDYPACVRNDGPLGTYEVNGRLLPRYGHLFLGTDEDNNFDKEAKRRGNHPLGEASGLSKLTVDAVLEIRRLYAEGNIAQWELGERFGVTQGVISKIIRRALWAHC